MNNNYKRVSEAVLDSVYREANPSVFYNDDYFGETYFLFNNGISVTLTATKGGWEVELDVEGNRELWNPMPSPTNLPEIFGRTKKERPVIKEDRILAVVTGISKLDPWKYMKEPGDNYCQ